MDDGGEPRCCETLEFIFFAVPFFFAGAETLKYQKAAEAPSNSEYPRNMNYIAVPDSGSVSTEDISTIEDIDIRILNFYADRFPFITALCRIVDEHNRMVTGLDEGNFDVLEMHGGPHIEQYPLIVNQIGGGNSVDFVFCIDSTGSMGSMIDEVVIGISWLLDSLASSGLSYRFGLVTFADYVTFPYGYDLTGDCAVFESWISSISASGGGDAPEVSFDAISDALDSMNWRPDACPVVIMITDASPHYLGDGTPYSDVTMDMVLGNILSHNAKCYCMVDTGYIISDSCYRQLMDYLGGEFVSWSGAEDIVEILPPILDGVIGAYFVSWTSSIPVPDGWRRDVKIRVDFDGLLDTDEDVYFAPIAPSVEIIEPMPETWTSDSFQNIVIDIDAGDYMIDASTIVFTVQDIALTLPHPFLTFIPPRLKCGFFVPFNHGDTIRIELSRVMDDHGNIPLSGPLGWRFFTDFEPPRIGEMSPSPGEIIENNQPNICFDVWDNESGLDAAGVLFAVYSTSFGDTIPLPGLVLDTDTPGVSIFGGRFCWGPSIDGYEFLDGDTVCVTILRAEDTPDYGEPNNLSDSLSHWCFLIGE